MEEKREGAASERNSTLHGGRSESAEVDLAGRACTLGKVGNEWDIYVGDGLWRTRQRINRVITSNVGIARKMLNAE